LRGAAEQALEGIVSKWRSSPYGDSHLARAGEAHREREIIAPSHFVPVRSERARRKVITVGAARFTKFLGITAQPQRRPYLAKIKRSDVRRKSSMHHTAMNGNLASVAKLSESSDFVRLAHRLTYDLAAPMPAIYWADLLLSAMVGYGAFAVCWFNGMSLLGLAAAIVATLALYRCVAFIHEVTHLRKRAPFGFWTAWHVLVGVPFLVPVFLYDGVHNFHHAKAYYGTPRDPEYVQLARGRPWEIAAMLLMAPLHPLFLVARFLIVTPVAALVPAIRPFVIQRLTGLVMNSSFRRTEPPPFRTSWLVMETVTTLYAWTALILLLLGILPWNIVLMWFGVWAGVSTIDTLRTIVSHHYENDGEPMEVVAQLLDSVNVPPPAMLPMLWAPVGLRYHGLHHLLPNLPYHSLGRAHRRLLAELPAGNPYRQTMSHGIIEVLARMLLKQKVMRNAEHAAGRSLDGSQR
jgi:fatty acid desaturase